MITLTVQSFNGGATERLSATFDELGGTIGRADTNQLVLPDPERTISRIHAQVAFRNGGFALVDRGSNPVLVNGRPLGNGHEAPLANGDQVQIGGYVLGVEVRAATGAGSSMGAAGGASSSDPFADLMGLGAAGSPASMASTVPPASSPFGNLLGDMPPAAAPSTASAFPAPPAAGPGGIPADWDPFAAPAPAAVDPARSLGTPGGGIPDDFGLDLGNPVRGSNTASSGMTPTRSEESLDNLFGLGAPGGSDPLAGSAFQDPLSRPNTAASQDPLRAFGMQAATGQNAVADNVSELNTPFIAPGVTAAKPPAPAATPTGNPAPQGAVLSWGDSGPGEGRTIIRPANKPPAASAAPATPAVAPVPTPTPAPGPAPSAATIPDDFFAGLAPSAPAPLAAPTAPPIAPAVAPPVAPPVAAAAPAPRPAASAQTSAAFAGGADVQALLAAFREGLGVPGLQLDALTPELMKLIGQLLHESTRGTIELLVARAALKREIRAEVTMIVARENNPLKFSPSVDVALTHLLSPPARGFMPAAPAMRDAYDDLRAHQFGFVAGMRAALEGVLKRFDPEQLEGKLTQKSVINSLLPATRKAKLWELFQELYGQISEEAAEDFHELFGKEFLRAYEAHIDQLKSGQR